MSVILNECEGSITVVRKPVRRHPSNRFFTPSFPQGILVSVQNDRGMEVIIMRGDVNRHLARQRRICCCSEESGKVSSG